MAKVAADLKKEIENIARGHEIDLLGFAKVDDVKLAHPPRPANDLLPGSKTVIVFAGALLKGSLDCPRGTKGAIKDSQVAYDRMQNAGSAIGRFLEKRGHLCYVPPVSMPCDSIKHRGKGYFAGEWSHRQAAIAAGLGVKGWNNLLVTPEYGPRVRLGSMLTTADIDFEPRTVPEDTCIKCGKCIDICPVNALDPNRELYLDQPVCKSNYIRPYLDQTPLKTLKNVFTTPGYGAMGFQYVMEGYYFSCAKCQAVCPVGTGNQEKG